MIPVPLPTAPITKHGRPDHHLQGKEGTGYNTCTAKHIDYCTLKEATKEYLIAVPMIIEPIAKHGKPGHLAMQEGNNICTANDHYWYVEKPQERNYR